MKIQAGLPTGVNALLFEAAERRRRLETRLSEHLRQRGFSEVLLPILDYADPYAPLLSERARESLYRFVDRDGQLIALRSDFTPMLARLLAPRLDALDLPLRLFYRGDVVRYHEPKAGQLREYSQLGGEVITTAGENPEPGADLELLELVLDLLLGALRLDGSRLLLVLGSAGVLESLLAAADDPPRLATAIARRDRAAVRHDPVLLEIVEAGTPAERQALGSRADDLEVLERLRAQLEAQTVATGLRVVIDLAEFAADAPGPSLPSSSSGEPSYYDGPVFRIYERRPRGDAALARAIAQPIASGGRYDRLFRSLGADVSAAGFSIGLDFVLQLLASEGHP